MKKSYLVAAFLLILPLTLGFKHKKPQLVPTVPEKINLVWQADVPDAEADFSRLPKVVGVNVISPCWFDIATAHGLIRNKITNKDYVTHMHALGYKIWPLITNSFNPELTHALIHNPLGRENLRNNLLELADKYKFDGYNFDFENIADEDKNGLTDLVQELAAAIKPKKLVLSMDITMPSNTPYWSACYDRKALAKELDYIMLMAYDQHTPRQHQRGSTAALNWVTDGLKQTLNEVPATKLILGLPLYSRLWDSQGQSLYANGRTISMPAMEETIVKQKVTPVWLPNEGQFYVEYQKYGKTYSFWQEDAASLLEKVKLVYKYDLPGIASWRKGFETDDIWLSIDTILSPLKYASTSQTSDVKDNSKKTFREKWQEEDSLIKNK